MLIGPSLARPFSYSSFFRASRSVQRRFPLSQSDPRSRTKIIPHASRQLHVPSKVKNGTQYSLRRNFSASRRPQLEGLPADRKSKAESAGDIALTRLSRSIGRESASPRGDNPTKVFNSLPSSERSTATRTAPAFVSDEHHLYVYAHKHNTHITLSEPQHEDPNRPGRSRQKMLLSLSAGNLGFRKAQRGSYDAAYQLGAYFMSRLQDDGLLVRIQRLELVLRGFGQGREAITKILLGMEGVNIRDRIIRVVDASRVKMGGQRSPKPRRLG